MTVIDAFENKLKAASDNTGCSKNRVKAIPKIYLQRRQTKHKYATCS
jgi:hypothetical protein